MKIEIDTVLYHADWCGFCKIFMPEWNKFQNEVKSLSDNGVTFTAKSIEESSLDKGEMPKINGHEIRGFPTVKTTIRVDDDIQEIEYNGSRKSDELLHFVKLIAKKAKQNMQ